VEVARDFFLAMIQHVILDDVLGLARSFLSIAAL
jgi:hypothetical protein